MHKISVYFDKIRSSLFRYRGEDENFFFVYRLGIGFFSLFHFLACLNDFERLYITNDIISQDAMRIQKPWFIPNINEVLRFLGEITSAPEKSLLTVFISLYIIFCITLAIGFRTRLSAIGLVILHLIIVKGSPIFSYGVDYFTTISLFYCAIFPLGHGKGIDKATIYKDKAFVNPSPYRRILQIHMCIVYFAGGIEKIIGEDWRNGESFWKSVHLPGFTGLINIDYGFMASFPITAILAGWFVVILELFYPLFIWKKSWRGYVLVLISLMHVGILLSLGLYFFSILMIILNLTAFLNLSSDKSKK
ncbi:HTTM domain-containing protein [Sphingobacterium siyangense]|uniref:HTTM domain-containing protein n=1 Tax=Sphingobacterium siyangense TaxID=459529 RepID=UPI0031F7DD9A